MVSARSVNSWRVMPFTNTMGRNTQTVVRVEAVRDNVTSFVPSTQAVMRSQPSPA